MKWQKSCSYVNRDKSLRRRIEQDHQHYVPTYIEQETLYLIYLTKNKNPYDVINYSPLPKSRSITKSLSSFLISATATVEFPCIQRRKKKTKAKQK